MIGSDSQVTAAFVVGLTSAAGFATANALQHHAARRVPESIEKTLRVLAHLLVGVVLAVPLRAALEKKTPTPSELRAVCTTVAGLALFVVCTNPTPSDSPAPLPVGASFVGACLAIALIALRLSARNNAEVPLDQARHGAHVRRAT